MALKVRDTVCLRVVVLATLTEMDSACVLVFGAKVQLVVALEHLLVAVAAGFDGDAVIMHRLAVRKLRVQTGDRHQAHRGVVVEARCCGQLLPAARFVNSIHSALKDTLDVLLYAILEVVVEGDHNSDWILIVDFDGFAIHRVLFFTASIRSITSKALPNVTNMLVEAGGDNGRGSGIDSRRPEQQK